MSVSNKLNNVLMNFGFMAKRKRPTIMCIIINYRKIKFIARNTQNWRGPDITMNEFKRCRGTRDRTSKGQPSVFAKLAGMTNAAGCFITLNS